MDRVRFGRALGYGARQAAKSLQQAAEAASAPNASSGRTATRHPAASQSAPELTAARAAQQVYQTRQRVTTTGTHARTHARTLGRSVWSPLAQFSSVLWLEVTGTFFTLLALFLSQGLWKARSAVHLPLQSHAAHVFYIQLLAFICFTYFAVSNFVRARLRGRR